MISDIYELSPIQAGMLFHRVFAPESRAYFDQFSCRLTGAVDPVLLQRAWQQLVDRHPVFRTSFHWEGLDKPVQVVHAQAALPWQELDWRGLAPELQSARWDDYLDADRARGFDPEAAPLMRAAIARLTETDYFFCWSHHHLLLDGWCLTLVLSELFERYDAMKQARPLQLAPVRPYSEYIKWLQHRDRDGIEQHWRDTLRGFSAATPILASAASDATRQAQADAVVERHLAADLSESLRTTAARHRLTLNTLVQGAWALVLSRHSGADDVVFGATVSGRPPEVPGIETMLGVFINTVPVRLQVPNDLDAAAWLTDVQAKHAERERFTAIPLSEIQKLSDIEPGSPLFESNVIVMNYRMDERLAGGAAGIGISDLRIVDQTDIPLTLQVTPGRTMTIEILFDSHRFERAAVERMLGHIAFLLEQMAQGLDRPLGAFEIVTPAERAQLFDEFNATHAPLDPNQTALDWWDACVTATPDAVALECDDRRLTYRELDEWSSRIARGMQASTTAGRAIGPDALVAIAFKRSERLLAAILAAWKCGAGYMPIDPDYPAERISQVLGTAMPCIVVRDGGTLDDGLESVFADRMCFASVEELDRAGVTAPAQIVTRATGANLAYVIFTSGSTGQPKGAMVEHTGMLNHLLAKVEDLALDQRSVIVQNASHCFDISVWQCFAALIAGGRTIVYTDAVVLDPLTFLDRVGGDRVTVLEVVPSYLAPLLDRLEDDDRQFPELQFLLVTGETIKPSLVERWFARFPAIPMVNAYGPTEASDDITHAFMRKPPATATVPVGRPIRNFHIYIVDEGMRLCPIGVAGELCVAGPGVGRGYLNDPAKTAAAFLEDPFRSERGVRMYRTGDVGWFTADGTILLAGRKDHQVKVRGYRIELGDIEAALTSLEWVRDAVVVDRRDRGSDASYLAAYVSLRDTSATADQLLAALGSRLPEYMIPATCTVLEALPLTSNGKIDRKALPAPERDVRPADTVYAPPRTPAEQALATIWSDVLGVGRPGIHDNFFAVGGDSILSMQIVSRASRAGLELTPRDVFQHQTIAELAAVARTAKTPPVAPGPRSIGPAPLTPAQRRFFEDVTVDRHHYNQSILLEVPATFDPESAERALAMVVAHHESLRLRFAEMAGEWRQSVADSAPAPVAIHDLSSLTSDERERAIDRMGGELQASLNIEHGPLLRAAFFRSDASDSGRLLIVVHHLAIDGVSWRIFVDDLAMAYKALTSASRVDLVPVPTPFLDWALTSAISLRPSAIGAVDVPTDVAFDPALNTVESGDEITIVLDESITRAFLTLTSRAYRAGPTELLLASVALAYQEWGGGDRVAVDLETHGRNGDRDLTRTIGWFTSTTPVRVDASGDMLDAIRSAKDEWQRATTAAVATSRPAILLNYHGRIDRGNPGDWPISTDPHGPARSLRQRREYLLEINGLVADGRLRATIAYSRHLHRQETIHRLAGALERQIIAMVEWARSGHALRPDPSQFPAARLDRTALDALLARTADVEDVYELSPTQQGLLFHGLVEHTSDAYFNQLTCVLQGALDVGAFQDAWARVVERHAALRTSFHWKDLERPLQVVHTQAPIPWSIEDWSSLSSDEQDRRWIEHGESDRAMPFAVSSPPLMRCALRRVAPDAYRFRWSQHHLLLDGWSSSIVLNDVLTAYDALVGGRAFDPPAPPPFRDHISWLQRQDHRAAEQFWRGQLEGFEAPTPLVIGLPEMQGRWEPGRFAEAETVVPEVLTARLAALAASQRITLNTLVQGAWSLLLSRHSGDRDVVFGAIASGRSTTLERSEEIVGLFINTIPVRARIAEDAMVFDWLRELQRQGAEREVFSYSSLADVQRWSAVTGGAPLFDTILIFENYPVAEALAGAGHALVIDQVQALEPNNYPMTLVVTPGESIALKIMFRDGRFDRATIERTLGHLLTLLTSIAAAPQGRVGELAMLTEAERAQLESWNHTAVPLPAGETVLSLIERQATQAPDRIAVVCDGERITYRELNDRANRLASEVMTAHAPAPEARIVVLLHRSPRLIETVLALWKCGAAYVPVDPNYPAERILTIIRNARASVVVTSTAEVGSAQVDALRGETPLVDLDALPTSATIAAVEPPRDIESLAYVIYTSGSTGMPKGAMVEHAGFLNHVLSMIDDLALDATSVVAQTASHCFDISMWQLFAALVAGGTTAIYPDAVVHKPEQLAAGFDRDRVSAAQFVPSYLNVFLDAQQGAATLSTLTHMVVIGEALTPATLGRWFDRYPHIPLMNAYGPTEAADSVAHIDFTAAAGDAMVPIGRPIQNMSLYVMDASMRLCPIGVKGEIGIAGVGVGRGYLFDEVRTRAVFQPDPFSANRQRLYRSGDIGCYGPDGAVRFFGRRDHQVKVRGHRIELGEVESCLAAIDGVRDAAVVTRTGTRGDHALCAYVTAHAGTSIGAATIKTALGARLPAHAIPDSIAVLAEMPVMSNGKIDRRALAMQDIEAPAPIQLALPATDTERAVARIWSTVLERDDIGVDQSFFDLGGHSLKAIQIVSRINHDCGVDIEVGDLFERGTVRGLAALIDGASATDRPPLVAGPVRDDYDASAVQKRMWLASRTPEGSAEYNMAGAFWLDGEIDRRSLQRAFHAVAERHESLRTVFGITAGALRQRVISIEQMHGLFRETDWSDAPLAAEALDAAVEARIAEPFDLARGPLFDVEVIDLVDRRRLLIVRLHHIIGDAQSIRIILQEAMTLYAAFRKGQGSPLPPLPIQYRDFVAWQKNLIATSGDRSRRYWRQVLQPVPPRTAFAPDAPDATPATGGGRVATCELDATLTARVRALAAEHRTTVFGVVVSAVYALLHRYTQQDDVLIGSTVSRRDHPLLESQVGCYIDTVVLRGRAGGQDRPADLLVRTAHVCRGALAHRDYPFAALLEDLQIDAPPNRPPLFDVLVDYVPGASTAGAVDDVGVAISERRSAIEAAHFDTMFLIAESDSSATMSIQLVFDANRFQADTVDSARARLLSVLQWLAGDDQRPLGDVDLLGLRQSSRRRLRINLNTR